MPYAHITGWGVAIPENILTNAEIAQMVDTNDEWIRSRTGIEERRIAATDESTASLAAQAAFDALEVANLSPADVDLIIVSTSSPEHIFPATAALVQDQIGATKAGAFDLSAACTGFIYALNMGAQAVRSGSIKNALIIGAETLSRLTNWEDRNTCILFGDGAGAFVLQASEKPGGVLSAVMRADGSGGDLLSVPAGGSKLPTSEQTLHEKLHFIQMNGREVFRFATRVMAQATREVVKMSGFELDEIDWVIPHQANRRIIEKAASNLKLPLEKFIINVERFGNTSTASIPMATAEALGKAQIKPGDKIVFVGFGAGLTWGALSVEWTGPLAEPEAPLVWPYRFEKLYSIYARFRSAALRVIRTIEGFVWGRKG
ncbi:MAG TPA: 3-oxoacyl-ACP synthase [Chloroflexi bacterium]|nr:3-oxoacyl-ACP synthase [Chloroflexota bacterium]HBY08193.1 3-oxoacyl-ACP synthase [Chloroflexota bacterium]